MFYCSIHPISLLPVPYPKITSSTPSWFTSKVRIGDSEVSLGNFMLQTSVTLNLLQGNILTGFGLKLVLLTIQSLNLSSGNGKSDVNITTNAINPVKNFDSSILLVLKKELI